MEVKNFKNDSGYTYIIKKDNKRLKIRYAANWDLYWDFTDLSEGGNRHFDYGFFTIDEKDGLVYRLLEELYESIATADPFFPEIKFNPVGAVTAAVYDLDKYSMYKELFDGEKITWISDDRDYESDHLVRISKRDNTFLLEFAKKKKIDAERYFMKDFSGNTINIRFNNSGSYYKPFNCAFMNMYNKMNGYSTEFGEMPAKNFDEVPGQIHIEDHILSLRK